MKRMPLQRAWQSGDEKQYATGQHNVQEQPARVPPLHIPPFLKMSCSSLTDRAPGVVVSSQRGLMISATQRVTQHKGEGKFSDAEEHTD